MKASKFNTNDLLQMQEQVTVLKQSCAATTRLFEDSELIENFGNVALEHSLSAPVVAVMQATPGFARAVSNFPDATLYNIIPAAKASVEMTMGMESIQAAQTTIVGSITEGMEQVVANYAAVLQNVEANAADLRAQLEQLKVQIEAAGVDDTLLASLKVNTLSEAGFLQALSTFSDQLAVVQTFNADTLRNDPGQLQAEIEAIKSLTDQIGGIVGLELTASGLVDAAKVADVQATEGSFEEKSLTVASLSNLLENAQLVCDNLMALGQNREVLVAALQTEVEQLPAELSSSEVVYGAQDHNTLISCHATLVAKLAFESTALVSRLIGAAEIALDARTKDDLHNPEDSGATG